MIKLKNVSKYYYSKGMITSGITKVNLEFDVGEFVVITGESGSGKSTLLNVISGLDTYEEGEMYIEGHETSHYSNQEFENYRKKYIGNIFQNFNLVNSYTVYQNIELILWINGVRDSEIKERVPAIIERVGLSDFSKTKVSKLSGGQKQRVAIARALAKDTAVIVADEPTGNLDSQSAEEIVELLDELSQDKLVIVVTHNYEQFADHATRLVKMNDGRVIEDKKTSCASEEIKTRKSESGRISFTKKLRLGARNTFNIPAKFLLLLLVFAFVTIAVTAVYTNYKETQIVTSEFGYNTFFVNYSDDRIVVKKNDSGRFTEDEISRIENMEGVGSVARDDVLLDKSTYIEDDYLSFYGYIYPANAFDGKPDYGRVPEKGNEALLRVGTEDGALMAEEEDVLGRTCSLMDEDGENELTKVKICGIKYVKSDEMTDQGRIYAAEGAISSMRANAYSAVSKKTATIGNKAVDCGNDFDSYRIMKNSKVKRGCAVVPSEFNEYGKKGKAVGTKITLSAKNMYFNSSKTLKITAVTTEKNYAKTIGRGDYEEHVQDIFINPGDYNAMFDRGIYQISVLAKDSHDVDHVRSMLSEAGLRCLPLKDAIIEMEDDSGMLDIVQIPILVILVIVVFFIAYFVTRLIFKSRDQYFSIVRMLGMSRKDVKQIMDIEIIMVVTIAFALFVAAGQLILHEVLNIEYIKHLVEYLTIKEYAGLYLILVLMAYLISGRAARKLFKTSAMEAYRGEA